MEYRQWCQLPTILENHASFRCQNGQNTTWIPSLDCTLTYFRWYFQPCLLIFAEIIAYGENHDVTNKKHHNIFMKEFTIIFLVM